MALAQMIDLDHLEKYVTGDSALRQEIFSIFIEQLEVLQNRFEIDQSDELWRITAHSLKGASRGVGAWKLGEVSEEAEKLIGDVPALEEKRAAVLSELNQLIAATISEIRALSRAA